MSLNELKTQRAHAAFADRLPKNASNQSGGTLDEGTENSRVLDEGKEKHTPKFIQHCVTAITENPKKLADVEAGGSDGKKGSPFAICTAANKKKTRSRAAKHSQGSHHTVKQYEKSLATLRESVEAVREANGNRNQIVFRKIGENPKKLDRRFVRYSPRG